MRPISELIDVRTLEKMPNGIVIYRTETESAPLLYANERVLRMFECSSLEEMQMVCQNDYMNFMHPDDYKHHITTAKLAWQQSSQIEHHAQYRIITSRGNTKMIDDSGTVLCVEGDSKYYLCTLVPLDRQIIYSLESSDSVTGLLSFGQFIQYCENFLLTESRHRCASNYHVAFFNVRRFKDFNVTNGQRSGDHVLKRLAGIILDHSATKIVSRFGGDHFLSIMLDQKLDERVHEIVDTFMREYSAQGLELDVGLYPITDYRQDVHKACDLAKAACDSIRNTREHICVYSEAFAKKMKLKAYIIQHLDEALENGYVKPHYQPIVRTLTRRICGFEALARWVDPTFGFLSPADFIPVLEESRKIYKLDLHILREICREMHDAIGKGYEPVPVSFNVSRYDFLECDCFAEAERIIASYGISREMINIEITESVFMENPEILRRELSRFHGVGYQVWMDDFGSGYSSLNVLKEHRFDEIKLDLQFMSHLDEKSLKVIKSVVLMAKELGIRTIAEGVETEDQFAMLQDIGCEKVQGYLFSPPRPLAFHQQMADAKRIFVEGMEWRKYYDDIGACNFMTERALSIVEYDGENFSFLFVNAAFKKVWETIGVSNIAVALNTMNSPTSPVSQLFRDMRARAVPGGKPEEVVYSIRGKYVRLIATCLAEHGKRASFDVEIVDLSVEDAKNKQEMYDYVFRMMYGLYDSIYFLDLSTGQLEALVRGSSDHITDMTSFHEQARMNPTLAAVAFIHPDDYKAYAAFTDLTTLVDRVRSAKKKYLTEYFRTRTSSGKYAIKTHTMLYLPDTNRIIYCTRATSFLEPGVLERIAPEFFARHAANQSVHLQEHACDALTPTTVLAKVSTDQVASSDEPCAVAKAVVYDAINTSDLRMMAQFIEHLPLAVVVYRMGASRELQSTRCIYTSGRALQALHIRERTAPNVHEELRKRLHPDDADRVMRTLLETAPQHKGCEIECRVLGDDGRYHWTRFIDEAYPLPDGRCDFFGIYMDIEEQKALEEDEAHIQRFVESILRSSLSSDPNDSLNAALAYLGTMLQGERAWIIERDEKMHVDNNTYEWCAPGVEPEKDFLTNMPQELAQPWFDIFASGMPIVIPDVDDIKVSLPKIYETLVEQKIRSVVVAPLYRENGMIAGCIGVDNPPVEDIEKISKLLRRIDVFIEAILRHRDLVKHLETMSYMDQLTGLGNRHALYAYAAETSTAPHMGVIYCDVNGLKQANDTYGHAAGDVLLKRSAATVMCVTDGMRQFRTGGDEYVVMTALHTEQEIADKAEEIKTWLRQEGIHISVGVSYMEKYDGNFARLLKQAEGAMYEDKRKFYETNSLDRRRL